MNLPENIRLHEPFRFYRFSTGWWAVSIINISIRKTRSVIFKPVYFCRYAHIKFVVVLLGQSILASLFARAQVTTKLLFLHSRS